MFQPGYRSPTSGLEQRFCSKSCWAKAWNQGLGHTISGDVRSNAHRGGWAYLTEEARNRKRARARARRTNRVQTWDGVPDEEIWERDGSMCRMPVCLYRSRRIDMKRKYPDPRSISTDHIVPLADGGTDTAVNKRAAHHGCNMSRGRGKPGEQQALNFGA